jgi:hypothetical protein
MAQFVLYRHQRDDGGRRTGLEINGTHAWDEYEPGKYDDDPALRWYVDVRGEGNEIPGERDALRQWLLDHADLVDGALRRLADRFEVGFDHDYVPVRWQIPDAPEGVSLEIAVNVARRSDAVRAAEILSALAIDWRRILSHIPAMVPVA